MAQAVPGLVVLAESNEAGLCLIEDKALGNVFMFNHLEYDTETLANEYARDQAAGRDDVPVPRNYFTDDDPSQPLRNTWRGHGHLLFLNWINDMYQYSPIDIADIGKG